MIAQSELKKLVHYNPETGVFIWLFANSRRIKANDIAGSLDKKDGYVRIEINGKAYLAHRLAWLYVNGWWPQEVDHINHGKSDNRIVNLREVTHIENHKNKSLNKNNMSRVTGVCWASRDRRWLAYVTLDSKQLHLGHFKDKFEAICARMSANNKYGFHKNHGVENV